MIDSEEGGPAGLSGGPPGGWGWDLCRWRAATCVTCQRRRSWATVADRACPACAFCQGRRRSRRLAGLAGGCGRDPDREPPPSTQPRLSWLLVGGLLTTG